jgi:hypothetical protein
MTTATHTAPAVANKLMGLGIQDLDVLIHTGTASVKDVFDIVQGRIDKRTALGEKQLVRVVEYRNHLVSVMNSAGGASMPAMPVPTYSAKALSHVLPSDPDQLADVVFATVGAANVGQVIARLTARILGA